MSNPPTEITKKTLREFGLIMAAGLIGIFGILLPWIWGYTWPTWPWIAGGVFAGFGIIFPPVLKPIFQVWMKIGLALGFVNSRIILGFIFFALFMPVALFLKLIGKDPMARKLDQKARSYRVKSDASPREQLERPY